MSKKIVGALAGLILLLAAASVHAGNTLGNQTEGWTEGNTAGRALATSDREKELASKNRLNQEIVVEARNQ